MRSFGKTLRTSLTYLFACLFFQGCISLSTVEESNIQKFGDPGGLNGHYFMKATEMQFNGFLFVKYHDFSQFIIRDVRNKGIQADSTDLFSFKINALNDRELKISFYKKDRLIKSVVIAGQMKKDGYFYVKNRNIIAHNIPLILGAYDYLHIRIGIDTEKNLIVDGVKDSYGAFLLILFASHESAQFKYKFYARDTPARQSNPH